MVSFRESGGAAGKKTTQGRRKIEIKKIDKLSSRRVAFSKRRVGLFKKASELCVLCGVEIAVVVHSLGNRVFSFGSPSTDAVINRYLRGGDDASASTAVDTSDLNRHYSDVSKELEVEKKRRDGAKKAEGGGDAFWWDQDVTAMELDELEQYATALEDLVKNIDLRANDIAISQLLPPPVAAASLNPTAAAFEDFLLC